jgi:L-serine dehydratase
LGFAPERYDHAQAETALAQVTETATVQLGDLPAFRFDPAADLIFDCDACPPGHANAMTLTGLDAQGDTVLSQVFYSIGGGFVLTEEELAHQQGQQAPTTGDSVPHPFTSAKDMLDMTRKTGLDIAGLKRANELSRMSPATLSDGLNRIWQVMTDCIDRGLTTNGTLPGGLNVRRRAMDIHAALLAERGLNLTAPHTINDWISVYAMAVNEENAGGGQVVTAPTNGAAGVLPATLRYYLDHVPGAAPDKVAPFLLTAAAIGGLVKYNASISGAEAGCQAEVGSASAMAAAGLCAVLGGSPTQVENAAEIALEHHLGMTCDPVKGLVQVPCIERNGLGAIKAVAAASLALRGDGQHLVSLDACIETMRQTGQDMNRKYKETSLGGLAVNVPNC